MTKILITGSSGQVGSYLAKYLDSKYDVTGISRHISNDKFINKITTIGDIRDKNIIDKITKNVDIIIHTAAHLNTLISFENPTLNADINIIGTLNLLNASRKNNISKIIYFSTSAVYGNYEYLPIDEEHPLNPISPYGLSKLTAEKYCYLFNKLFNLSTVCIRPFNIYSTNEDLNRPYVSVVSIFADKIKKNEPLTIRGGGQQIRDFVHVKDVASFIEIILERNDVIGQTYNLGSGKPINILDLAKLILKIYKKDESNIQYEKGEEGKIEHSYADITKAKKIGYNPQITIEKGLICNGDI